MIKAIAAADKNWAIGKDNKLLASIPEDMKFFKETTTGNVIIMGRKTLESFPKGRPLADRVNIVLTSDINFSVENALTAHSTDEAIEMAGRYEKDIFIVGGGKVYEEMINYCDMAYITCINDTYDADTYFPNLDRMPEWVLVSESEELNHMGLEYMFKIYMRRVDYRE